MEPPPYLTEPRYGAHAAVRVLSAACATSDSVGPGHVIGLFDLIVTRTSSGSSRRRFRPK
jgi:hypothetical protein